jgi:hypothetical protein
MPIFQEYFPVSANLAILHGEKPSVHAAGKGFWISSF